jgi:light-regulated signal transduction histidine kinase (bacteriophytochrome)
VGRLETSPMDHESTTTNGTRPKTGGADLRLLEKQLERRTAQVERAAAALDRLAFELSHEVNKPLTMISGFGEILSSRYACELDSDANDFIGYILTGTERLRRLIDDITVSIRTDRVALGFPVHDTRPAPRRRSA